MLYKYLQDNYQTNEPIIMNDLDLPISNSNLRQMFKNLCDSGKVKRFDSGIYYLPKQTKLKSGNTLSSDTVAKYKYINRNDKIIGYYSGNTFANLLGITTQVPYVKEIVTNEASAICRQIDLNGQRIIIRKPKIEINNSNYLVLQLLDLLKDYQLYKDNEVKNDIAIIKKYIKKTNITKKQIDKYISLYPDKVYRSIYEMELYNVFAWR